MMLLKSLKDDIVIFGGYAAYTSLLAFFPFIIFLLTLAGFFGNAETSRQLIEYALTYLPREVVEVMAPVIHSILENESVELLTLGGLGALWAVSSGVEGLRLGLNKVYAVGEPRPAWKRRLQSIAIVITGSIIFLFLTMAVIAWPLVVEFAGNFLHIPIGNIAGLTTVRFLLSAVLLIAMFSALYKILPNRLHSWQEVLSGALLATALWLALAQLFSLYLAHFGNYNATYGSIGGVIITLIFFHYSATVILLGAELNCVIEQKKKKI